MKRQLTRLCQDPILRDGETCKSTSSCILQLLLGWQGRTSNMLGARTPDYPDTASAHYSRRVTTCDAVHRWSTPRLARCLFRAPLSRTLTRLARLFDASISVATVDSGTYALATTASAIIKDPNVEGIFYLRASYRLVVVSGELYEGTSQLYKLIEVKFSSISRLCNCYLACVTVSLNLTGIEDRGRCRIKVLCNQPDQPHAKLPPYVRMDNVQKLYS